MKYPSLRGRSILVVDDQPLICMDIQAALAAVGALPLIATNAREALRLAEQAPLSAAVLDHLLPDGDTTAVGLQLKARGIPFLRYSGMPAGDGIGRPVT